MNRSERSATIGILIAIGVGTLVVAIYRKAEEFFGVAGIGLCVGAVLSQVMLAGAWIVFGASDFRWRLLFSVAWIGVLTFALALAQRLADPPDSASDLLLDATRLCGLWAMAQAPLWCLVIFRGWKLCHRNSLATLEKVTERRSSGRELLTLLAGLSLIYILARISATETLSALLFKSRETGAEIYYCFAVVAATGAGSLAMLLPRLSKVMLVLLGAWLAVLSVDATMFTVHRAREVYEPHREVLPTSTAAVVCISCVCALAAYLRWLGYEVQASKPLISIRLPNIRWRLRFSLRTLLVTMALLGVGLGYLGNAWRRIERQKWLIAKIEAAEGNVAYSYEFGMGDELNEPHVDGEYAYILDMSAPTRVKRERILAPDKRVLEEETPPGPEILRRIVGDTAFAEVELVNLSSKCAEDFDVRWLAEFPELKVVTLCGPFVNDDALIHVAKLPKLQYLNLAADEEGTASGTGLARLQACATLESLGLSGSWLTNETLTGISQLTQLKSLGVSVAPQVDSAAVFANLQALTDLQEISLIRIKTINDEETQHLQRLKQLRTLSLAETTISDSTLAHLAELKELERIQIYRSRISDSGLQPLAHLHKLRDLKFDNSEVGDSSLAMLTQLPSLKGLSLKNAKITDGGVPAFCRLSHLEHLDLYPSQITNESALQLQTLTGLKSLYLGPHITAEVAGELKKALPKCRIVCFDEGGRSTFHKKSIRGSSMSLSNRSSLQVEVVEGDLLEQDVANWLCRTACLQARRPV